jgi:Secretion system C-terminal sorting domain
MKRITSATCLVVCILLVAVASVAQPPDTLWTRTFGGIDDDIFSSVKPTSDGGFICVGWTESSGQGGKDAWLVKLNSDGNEEWSFTYGDINTDVGADVIQSSDGGYVVAGYTFTSDWFGNDLWVFKTNSSGGMIWQNTYHDYNNDTTGEHGKLVREKEDGNYLVVGYGYTDIGVLEIKCTAWDDDGSISAISHYSISDADDTSASSLESTADGGFIEIGTFAWYSPNWMDPGQIWLRKLSTSGMPIWTQTYGDIEEWENAGDAKNTADGGYIVSGTTSAIGAGGYDAWLIKTDANGNEVWNHAYGSEGSDRSYSVVETEDHGYLSAGTTTSFGAGGTDIYLVRTDSLGNEIWSSTHGGVDSDVCYEIVQTPDDGSILVGYTQSFGAGERDGYLIRLAPEGPQPLVTITLTPHNTPIQIPAAGGFLTFDAEISNLLTEATLGQAWAVVGLPNGLNYVGPELLRETVLFEPGVTITAIHLVQLVPGYAPEGNYTYKVRAGFYPNDIYAQDMFEFEKLGVTAATDHEDQGWTTSGWTIADDKKTVPIPEEFSITSVYPNPFNPMTSISVNLPEAGELSVVVYNVTGRQVATLANGHLAAGQHQFTFDGSGLSSGIYFVHASVPGQMNEMCKVVLMK